MKILFKSVSNKVYYGDLNVGEIFLFKFYENNRVYQKTERGPVLIDTGQSTAFEADTEVTRVKSATLTLEVVEED